MGPRFTKRQWFIIKWTYPPLQWGLGALLIAYFGFLNMELFPAFILGFCVGIVHDLAIVAFGLAKWGDHYSPESPPAPSDEFD